MDVQTAPLPQSELAQASPVIRVANVTKQFGSAEPIIKNLSFEVEPGQIFCLLGPSGSGKSTIMRMLIGVYKPTSGEVWVLGADPDHFKNETRARFGYMPQQFVLYPELSVMDNIRLVASIYQMKLLKRTKKIQEALEFVNLWDVRKRLASKLSGGMQRRLNLACTLVHKPELIFMDEPTAGIDPILRAHFWERFKELSEQGHTIFVTTQYVNEADYCDKVAILSEGELLAFGTPDEIRQKAIGGGIINLSLEEISSPILTLLKQTPGFQNYEIIDSQNLRLTVENTAEAIMEIVTSFQEHNHQIVSIEPYRPDFEEIFVRLLKKTKKN